MNNGSPSVMYRRMLLVLRAHLRDEMNLLVDVAQDLALGSTQMQSPGVCRTCRATWRTLLAGILGAFVNELILRKEQTIHQIDMALERLDDGTYGLCWECDAQIPDAWLMAVPYAERCARCESQRVMHRRIA